MANVLYIVVPARTEAQEMPDWPRSAFPYALIGANGAVLQQGKKGLSELKPLASSANQVVLLLAAADVSVMKVPAPPMAYSKLKMALPNLVEEHLLGDAADSVLVSTPVLDGHCVVAAADKQWMQALFQAMQVLGARKLLAYAMSNVLAQAARGASAMLDIVDADMLASTNNIWRLSLRGAAPLAMGMTGVFSATQDEMAQEVLRTLMLMVPEGEIRLAVPATVSALFKGALGTLDASSASGGDSNFAELNQRLQLSSHDWAFRLAGLYEAGTGGASLNMPLDLMAPIAMQGQTTIDWSRWKWSIRLAAVLGLVWLFGLNLDAWHLKQQASGLRAGMVNSYRQQFPKENTVAYPLIQMQQKLESAKKLAGQSVPGDFLVMAAQFGPIWERVLFANQSSAAVTGLEYRNRLLMVKVNSMALVPLEALRTQLREQSLTLLSADDGVLQIGVRKEEGK